MSPLNRGPLVEGRIPPAEMRPLSSSRFNRRLVPHSMPPRMPLQMSPMFGGPGPLRQRLPLLPLQPAGLSRPNNLLPGPRAHGMVPGIMPPMLSQGIRSYNPMHHWYRRMSPLPLPPQMMSPIRSRFIDNGCTKGKAMNNTKKVNMLEAHLYPDNKESNDEEDESNVGSKNDTIYYCEICNRDFSCESVFTEHKSTHRLNDIDRCTFVADPLPIEKHISIQYSDNEKKWIEERKKKFPTQSNIMLREAENLEKLQRGEIIKQNCDILKTTRMNTFREMHKPRGHTTAHKLDDYSYTDETYKNLCPFPRIKVLLKENSNEMCRDEQTERADSHKEIADHFSDGNNDVPQALDEPKLANLSSLSLTANYETKEEKDTFPEEMSIKIRRNTLLEKLLSRPIQHERNVIFQCIKYIVDNKFLLIDPNLKYNY